MEQWVHGPMNQWVGRSMGRVERALDLESDKPRRLPDGPEVEPSFCP